MDAVTLVTCLTYLPSRQSVLIRGDHGVGKSQIVQALAKTQKKELIDVRASTMSEGDVVGYPDLERTKETGVASFALPSWYVRACNEPCILFLDELNRGLPGVLNSFFQIVLDRELGSGPNGKPKRLHPDTQVIAAVNWGNDYSVSEMDPALLSRFWVAEFKPTHRDWLVWAENNNIDSLMIDFIRQNPAHLRPTKAVEPGKIVPNQRSWEFLDQTLKSSKITLSQCGGSPPPILYSLAMGFVGVEAASSLVEFVKNYDAVITAEMVLDSWKDVEKTVKKLTTEKKLAIIEKVKNNCLQESWTLDQVKNLKGFFGCLTGEEKMSLYNVVLSTGRNGNVSLFHAQVGPQIMEIIAAAQKVSEKK